MVCQSWIVDNDEVRGILLFLEFLVGVLINHLMYKFLTKDLGDDE